MTVISLERRLQRIEAVRGRADRSIRLLSDEELAGQLCEISDDLADHAVAVWFLGDGTAPIAAEVLGAFLQEVR